MLFYSVVPVCPSGLCTISLLCFFLVAAAAVLVLFLLFASNFERLILNRVRWRARAHTCILVSIVQLWSEYRTSFDTRYVHIYLSNRSRSCFIYISTGSIELPLNYVHRHKFCIIFSLSVLRCCSSLSLTLSTSIRVCLSAVAFLWSCLLVGIPHNSCITFLDEF